MEDFNYFNASDWIITRVENGSGSSTEELIEADGGRLLITNDDDVLDEVSFNKVGESFLFEVGKKLWFDCLFQVTDSITGIVIGLQITDTTPFDVSDGVFFRSLLAFSEIRFLSGKGGVFTGVENIASLPDETDIRLSFFYNGVDSIKLFVNGVHKDNSGIGALPVDEEVTISFSVLGGVRSMSVDYIMVAKER